MKQKTPAVDRFTPFDQLPDRLRPAEAFAYLGIGRSAGYDLLRTKALPSLRLGKLIFVPREALKP